VAGSASPRRGFKVAGRLAPKDAAPRPALWARANAVSGQSYSEEAHACAQCILYTSGHLKTIDRGGISYGPLLEKPWRATALADHVRKAFDA
jgi:hypothetical protein